MDKIKLFYVVPQSTYERLREEKVTQKQFLSMQPPSVATKMKRIMKNLSAQGIEWDEQGNVTNSPIVESFNLFEMLVPAVRGTGEKPINYAKFLMYLKNIGVSSYNLSYAAENHD